MKQLFLVFATLMVMVSCAEKPQTISGTLANLGDGEIILEKFDIKGNQEVAKMNATEGKFSFIYSPEQTDLYILRSESKSVPLFLDQNSVEVTGDIDSVETIVVKGSDAHMQFEAYNKAMKPIQEKEQKIIADYRATAALNDQAKLQEIYKKYDGVQLEKKEVVKANIEANPASGVSAFLAQMTYGRESEPANIKEIIDLLDTSLAGNTYYDDLLAHFAKIEKVAVGQVAPDFELNDPDGNPMKLSSLRGKYILMDFWASWCGPCRRENPNVVKMYKAYKNKGFDIIGISLDREKDKWLEAIEKDELTWNHVSDLKYWDSMAAKLYAVSGIPHTILLDPEGKIIAKNLRGKELEDKLAELLD